MYCGEIIQGGFREADCNYRQIRASVLGWVDGKLRR